MTKRSDADLLVIINDLDIVGIAVVPPKAKPPLVVDSNAT